MALTTMTNIVGESKFKSFDSFILLRIHWSLRVSKFGVKKVVSKEGLCMLCNGYKNNN